MGGMAKSTNTVKVTMKEIVERSRLMAKVAARVAAENRGQDIVVLDVSKQTPIFDCFLIVTGTSRRQLQAISDDIDRVLKLEFGEEKLSISGQGESRWVVVDYGGLVVHLFDEEARSFYDLEGLWGDSQRLDLTEALKNTGATMSGLRG